MATETLRADYSQLQGLGEKAIEFHHEALARREISAKAVPSIPIKEVDLPPV
jgi:hypothetical protein